MFTVILTLEASEEELKPYVGSEGFERLKQLLETWEGTMDIGQGPMSIKVSFELTSGGSAIVEKVFEGMPMEMVTVYHDNSSKELRLTHYCMLHNQPSMKLQNINQHSISFEFSSESDIDVANEEHMHSLTIEFTGPDSMAQHWTKFDDGEMSKIVQVAYKRIQ